MLFLVTRPETEAKWCGGLYSDDCQWHRFNRLQPVRPSRCRSRVIVIVLLPLIGFAKQGHAVTPSTYTAILLLSCGEHYTNIWWCAPHYYIAWWWVLILLYGEVPREYICSSLLDRVQHPHLTRRCRQWTSTVSSDTSSRLMTTTMYASGGIFVDGFNKLLMELAMNRVMAVVSGRVEFYECVLMQCPSAVYLG